MIDDKPIKQLLAHLPEPFYKICFETDSEKALQTYYEFEPQIILLDMNMPVLSGYQVAEKFRSKGIDVPIMFVTRVHGIEDEIKAFEEYKASYFVLKPLYYSVFKWQVTRLFEHIEKDVLLEGSKASVLVLGDEKYAVFNVLDGINVIQAKPGKLGTILKSESPAIIFISAALENEDAVYAEVNSYRNAHRVHVISIQPSRGDTAFVNILDRAESSLALGADDYLEEPLNGDIIRMRINVLFSYLL